MPMGMCRCSTRRASRWRPGSGWPWSAPTAPGNRPCFASSTALSRPTVAGTWRPGRSQASGVIHSAAISVAIIEGWTCGSMSPGISTASANRSSTSYSWRSSQGRSVSRVPTSTIRSPRTASAVASGNEGSMVWTRRAVKTVITDAPLREPIRREPCIRGRGGRGGGTHRPPRR